MIKYKVIKSRTNEFINPITVHKNEKVVCVEESNGDGDWVGWVLCKTENNQGWIPYQIIERQGKDLRTFFLVDNFLGRGKI